MKYQSQHTNQSIDRCESAMSPENLGDSASKYLTALVHELRNPLNNIMLSVESLSERLDNDTDDKMDLDIIRRGARRINNLIDSILNLKRYDFNNQSGYSLHHLLDEVLEIAGDRIFIKHIAVHKLYETQDFTARMNEEEIKIALTNIVINAVEAMAPQDGKLSVITKSVSGGDRFLVQIADNGQGISEMNLKKIFTSHLTTKRVGTGFGLPATYDILHSNHVGISVESKEGTGTCFRLLFEKA